MCAPHPPKIVLFMTPLSADACRFAMSPGPETPKIRECIESRGGLLEKKESSSLHSIPLAIPNLPWDSVPSDGPDVFDVQYVYDCIRHNRLLPNLSDYRLSDSVYEPYDPVNILCGYVSWAQLPKLKVPSQESFNPVEEMSILKDILVTRNFKSLTQPEVWKSMERRKVCSGKKSWTSMMGHFNREILPSLRRRFASFLTEEEMILFTGDDTEVLRDAGPEQLYSPLRVEIPMSSSSSSGRSTPLRTAHCTLIKKRRVKRRSSKQDRYRFIVLTDIDSDDDINSVVDVFRPMSSRSTSRSESIFSNFYSPSLK